jgi:hypothetical protein
MKTFIDVVDAVTTLTVVKVILHASLPSDVMSRTAGRHYILLVSN